MNPRKIKLVWLGFWCLLTQAGFAQYTEIDSTFWLLSLPEIQSHRAYYMQELQALQEEKKNLILRGIEDGERLLEMQPDAEVIDEILVRLADLYYYKEKDDYLTRMELFDEQIEQGLADPNLVEPKLDCSRSLAIYQRIVDEFPQSAMVDDAIYNQGFLYEEMGDGDRAKQVYFHLINEFPDSKYVPEAYMRLAEYHFNPPVNDVEKAIEYYEQVLDYRDNPRYDEALYKLGWSHYRLSHYPEAISAFTTLVENLRAVEAYNPSQLATRADLRGEAIEYISISFIDFGGPTKAREFLGQINDPEWGWDVLDKLGDVYMQEKEDYINAVLAYTTLLEFDPLSKQAPDIQNKIVACYQIMEDDDRTFAVRQDLFEKYKADTGWWKDTNDEKAKLRAYALAEQALRENINMIISKAEEASDPELYKEAVELGNTYLESFPEDPYAYMIRWNVALIQDTKLHEFRNALQEYLTICMVYNTPEYEQFAREKGLSTIKDAAENAIVVADSLVNQERRLQPPSTEEVQLDVVRDPTPLTAAEQWLAMAYENYLKLFPFEKNTPTILANTGALYYTHNQFTEAVKYFKTLMKYFPQSDQIQYAQYSILESYFGKHDFDSAEILAKKIVKEAESPEMKLKAQKRLGEAIFFKAQTKAEQGDAARAAAEYYRMALESPGLEFADRALFNAGREYERAGDFPSAIRAYELLRASYGGSELLNDALNNMAFDYGETGDYQKGAERYEQLASMQEAGDLAKDALYNAFVFYGKAKNWMKATQTGEHYTTQYDTASDAHAVYFQIGQYYQNMHDHRNAKRVYRQFSQRFPGSSLGVEVLYRLGDHYLERDSLALAENTFLRAYQENERLKSNGFDQNDFFAAEGLYQSSILTHDRYKQIAFFLPQATLDRQVQEKETMLQRLVSQYTKVAAFRTLRLPESVFRIGEVYDDYAKTWANQELPPMDATTRVVKQREINERTTQVYAQALNSYRRSITVLERILQGNGNGSDPDSASAARHDSLRVLTDTWYEMSKEKVSETLYQMAEVNALSIDRLLNAPVPPDLNDVAKLEYRSQVLIKAIKPLVDVVVDAHRRNLMVADTLQLKNPWTEASRVKMMASLKLLGSQYAALASDALSAFDRMRQQYRQTVLVSGSAVDQEQVNTMVNLVELSKSYSLATLLFYKRGVDKAISSGVAATDYIEQQETMVDFALKAADLLERYIDMGKEDEKLALVQFEKSGDLLYEEALAVFEDNVFYLEENLKALLEDAYNKDRDFQTPSPSGGWLAVRLVRLDPVTYSKQLDIPIQRIVVETDTTWWCSPTLQEGWASVGFQQIGWLHPQKLVGKKVSWAPAMGVTSRGTVNLKANPVFYVRKIINVPGYPIRSELTFPKSNPMQAFLNGELLQLKDVNKPLRVESLILPGENVLAYKCSTRDNATIESSMQIFYIPQMAIPHNTEMTRNEIN